MSPTSFVLRFSEFELADAIAKSNPPEGVTISVSGPFTQASNVGFVEIRVAIDISISIKAGIASAVILSGIARWIVKQLRPKVKRGKNKKARINNNIVPLNERNILLVIKKDITAQIEREAQRREDDAKKKSTGDNPV